MGQQHHVHQLGSSQRTNLHTQLNQSQHHSPSSQHNKPNFNPSPLNRERNRRALGHRSRRRTTSTLSTTRTTSRRRPHHPRPSPMQRRRRPRALIRQPRPSERGCRRRRRHRHQRRHQRHRSRDTLRNVRGTRGLRISQSYLQLARTARVRLTRCGKWRHGLYGSFLVFWTSGGWRYGQDVDHGVSGCDWEYGSFLVVRTTGGWYYGQDLDRRVNGCDGLYASLFIVWPGSSARESRGDDRSLGLEISAFARRRDSDWVLIVVGVGAGVMLVRIDGVGLRLRFCFLGAEFVPVAVWVF